MSRTDSIRESNRPFFRRTRKIYVATFKRKVKSLERTLENNLAFYPGAEVFEELLDVASTIIEYAEETAFGYIDFCIEDYTKIKDPEICREEIVILALLKELKSALLLALERCKTLESMECYNNFITLQTSPTPKRTEYVKELAKKNRIYFNKARKDIRNSIADISNRMEMITLISGNIPRKLKER